MGDSAIPQGQDLQAQRLQSLELLEVVGHPHASNPYVPNRCSVLNLQHVSPAKTEPPVSAVLLFPSLLPSGTVSRPFLQEDVS